MDFTTIKDAVRLGLNMIKPKSTARTDLERSIYNSMKENNFALMKEKYGPIKTAAYITHMEMKFDKEMNNG